MLLFRVFYTGEGLFLFLAWNLFLAFLPWYLSIRIMSEPKFVGSRLSFSLVFLCWLLLIPNSFYMITDLFHLHSRDNIPKWFDLAMILSFAWTGMLMGILSVMRVQKIVSVFFNLKNQWLFIIPLMYLNALGIFIGRYLRFNSWDALTNPADLASEVSVMFTDPLANRFEWSMIICFTALLSLFYVSFASFLKEKR
jgi:uncharacterized membrane protein